VSRMLHDSKYRAWVVKQVQDPMVRSFWEHEFANYDPRFRQEIVAPIQNKVGQIFLSPSLRNVLGQIPSRVNFRFIMDRQQIFIANLSKGLLGDVHSSLIGSLLVTGFELAALSRADTPEHLRKDFFLYADEFQHYATDSFATILSEARKYRLSLTLAHQYLGQLSDEISNAVFGNVGTLFAFRVSEADAGILQRQFGNSFLSSQFATLENFHLCVRLLNQDPFRATSLPPLKTSRQRRSVVLKHSRQRFSRRRRIVEEKIERWLRRVH
jgi:hypothetical protein